MKPPEKLEIGDRLTLEHNPENGDVWVHFGERAEWSQEEVITLSIGEVVDWLQSVREQNERDGLEEAEG